MKWSQSFGLVCLMGLLLPVGANAMTVSRLELGGGKFALELIGPIVTGDSGQVAAALMAPGASETLAAFSLNSPGGNLFEAEKLANGIKATGAGVFVAKNSMCASACFLLFAAASKKVVMPGASIGVHSASSDGSEDLQTMGMTTAFARDLKVYGVPPDILGDLVTTAPDQMNWLTIPQLEEMQVTFTTPEPDPAPRPSTGQAFASAAGVQPGQPEQPAPAQPAPAALPGPVEATAVVPSSQAPQAFVDGMRDRRGWEAWVNGLNPVAKLGAEFWASQRSLKVPARCEAQPGMNSEWLAGCTQARSILVQSDVRRHSEPLYRAGWNAI